MLLMLSLTIIFLFLGHEGAVWCGIILSEFGLMITGAADGNFKIWKAGQCKNTIKAHSQAIRGMSIFTHVFLNPIFCKIILIPINIYLF